MPQDVPMPRFGKTALELLDDKYTEPDSLWSKYGVQTAFGIFIGGAFPAVYNWSYRRPIFSGLHLYPIAIGLGAYGCQLWMSYRENYYAERDAIMRHYIQLHPDDFQPPERKKYSEVLLPWIPIR